MGEVMKEKDYVQERVEGSRVCRRYVGRGTFLDLGLVIFRKVLRWRNRVVAVDYGSMACR